VPLALTETPAKPAPIDKGKGVVVVPSEDEEDSAEGQVFKRRRTSRATPQVATSTTSSSHRVESLRENPPSATSPPQPMALEGGTETDESQVKEVFINEGRGNSPSHLKFFLLVFSKLKEDIK